MKVIHAPLCVMWYKCNLTTSGAEMPLCVTIKRDTVTNHCPIVLALNNETHQLLNSTPHRGILTDAPVNWKR